MMKRCTDCKWYDPDRQERIEHASRWIANEIIQLIQRPWDRSIEDDRIKEIQAEYGSEYIYVQSEEIIPFTCGNHLVVKPEDGRKFDSIKEARQFCGYTKPKHWRKQTEVIPTWYLEAPEKTFKFIRERIRNRVKIHEKLIKTHKERKQLTIFQRIKNLFGF